MNHSTSGYTQWKKLGTSAVSHKSEAPVTTIRIEELKEALTIGQETIFESTESTQIDSFLDSLAATCISPSLKVEDITFTN